MNTCGVILDSWTGVCIHKIFIYQKFLLSYSIHPSLFWYRCSHHYWCHLPHFSILLMTSAMTYSPNYLSFKTLPLQIFHQYYAFHLLARWLFQPNQSIFLAIETKLSVSSFQFFSITRSHYDEAAHDLISLLTQILFSFIITILHNLHHFVLVQLIRKKKTLDIPDQHKCNPIQTCKLSTLKPKGFDYIAVGDYSSSLLNGTK